MALQQATQDVLKKVEVITGKPVVVNPDSSLQTLATVRPARGSASLHVVSYKPSVEAAVDYTICFQCGFLLRLFQIPEADRYNLAASPHGKAEAERLLRAHLKEARISLGEDARLKYQEGLYEGVMRQLRSIPVGLRVDDWLRQDYPELATQQRTVAVKQLNDGAATLQPRIRSMVPSRIYKANVGMNAAFAAYWSRAWSDPLQVQPYKATGHLDVGEGLLQLWDRIPADPANDRRLIEAWGESLGLKGWFEFVPYVSE